MNPFTQTYPYLHLDFHNKKTPLCKRHKHHQVQRLRFMDNQTYKAFGLQGSNIHLDSGRAKQKKHLAGLSISKESALTLPLSVMSRFPFSLRTSSTSKPAIYCIVPDSGQNFSDIFVFDRMLMQATKISENNTIIPLNRPNVSFQ